MATQEIKAIIIDPETNLPVLVKIKGTIKIKFAARTDTQREGFIHNFLKPINYSLVPNYMLDPDYLELLIDNE